MRAAAVEVSNSEWLGWRGVAGTVSGCRVQGACERVKGAARGSEPVTGPADVARVSNCPDTQHSVHHAKLSPSDNFKAGSSEEKRSKDFVAQA